jgi:hypothetical protein
VLCLSATALTLGLGAATASATEYLRQSFTSEAAPYNGLLSELPSAGCVSAEPCHWTRWATPTSPSAAGEADKDPGNPLGDAETGAGSATFNFWHVQQSPQNISINGYIREHLIEPGSSNTSTLLPAPSGDAERYAWFGEAATGTYCGAGFQTETSNSPHNEPPSVDGCTSPGTPGGELVSPKFSLAGASSAFLRFKTWFEIESYNANSEDSMAVDYSTNGTTWTQAALLNPAKKPLEPEAEGKPYSDMGLQRPPEWTEDFVNLSAVANAPEVQLRFRFDADDYLYNGFRGWAIDNVSVNSTPPSSPKITGCSIGASSTPVIEGSGFLLGSKVKVGAGETVETEETLAQSSGRIELAPPFETGLRTFQVLGPEGALSNLAVAVVSSSECKVLVTESPHEELPGTTTTYTLAGGESTASDASKPATERGRPDVDLRNGEIEGEFELPEAGRAVWEAVVSQGASLASASPAQLASLADPLAALERAAVASRAHSSAAKCRKGYVRKAGRCLDNAPVAYGHSTLTAHKAGRYRLSIRPSGRVLAALRKGRSLGVRLTLTFTPAGTTLHLVKETSVTVHLKRAKAKS